MSGERTASLRVAGAAGGQMIVKPRQTVGIEPASPIRADGIAETGPEPGLSGGEQWVAQHRSNDPGTPHLANGSVCERASPWTCCSSDGVRERKTTRVDVAKPGGSDGESPTTCRQDTPPLKPLARGPLRRTLSPGDAPRKRLFKQRIPLVPVSGEESGEAEMRTGGVRTVGTRWVARQPHSERTPPMRRGTWARRWNRAFPVEGAWGFGPELTAPLRTGGFLAILWDDESAPAALSSWTGVDRVSSSPRLRP
jgi:hypothetical protein